MLEPTVSIYQIKIDTVSNKTIFRHQNWADNRLKVSNLPVEGELGLEKEIPGGAQQALGDGESGCHQQRHLPVKPLPLGTGQLLIAGGNAEMEALRLGKAGTQVPPELDELLDEILIQISSLFYVIVVVVTIVNKVAFTCTVLFHSPMKRTLG